MSNGRGRIPWPEGRRFAFTIFDDPDGQSLETSRIVYSFLGDLGFRTTKAVWPSGPIRTPNSGGDTCGDKAFRQHARALQQGGFEIAFHNAAPHDSTREEVIDGLKRFEEYFGRPPESMANHYNADALYWGPARLTGSRRALYEILTLGRASNRFQGDVRSSPYYWGDICRRSIRYCRNFVFCDIDTLRACPQMPYHDPLRPDVNFWFASSEGDQGPAFRNTVREANQERLEEAGGACIMYTHFGHGFVDGGKLNPRFCELMERLSRRNGWFVPVATMLDYLRGRRAANYVLGPRERARLEWKWLAAKVFHGTS